MKIIKFEASWCQPCKMLSKVINDVKDQITIEIEAVDIDQDNELTKQYQIRGVPTLVMVDGEKEIKRVSGVLTSANLLKFINT
jgi:thioredoxin 1